MKRVNNKIVAYSLAVLLTSVLFSCQNSTLDSIQAVTYKPEFHYVSNAKWAETMRQFSVYSTMLNQRLASAQGMSEDQRTSTLSILNKMDNLSLKLSQSKLNAHLDFTLFRQGITTAKEEVQQTPPNYNQLYVISTYCSNCHSKR